jgi:tetratricopeptide (TPR) repeat protein
MCGSLGAEDLREYPERTRRQTGSLGGVTHARRAWKYGISHIVCIVIATAMLSVTSTRASAEDSTDPKVEAEYQQLINDALNEYDRGSWEESAALFRRAHELIPSARTLRGLGLTAYEARRYPDSIRYLTDALTDTRHALTAKQKEDIEATLARARLFVGYLELQVDPAGTTVIINGQDARPDASGTVITDVGWIDVEARADGYEALTKRIRVNAGDHQTLDLKLTRTPPPQAAVAVAPAPKPALVEPHAEAAPLEATSSQPAADSGSPYTTWKWVTAGAAVAALGTGAALLIVQKAKAPAYNHDCVASTMPAPDCDDRKALLGGTLWTGSIIGLSVGAGLGVLSAVLFGLDANYGTERSPALACTGAGTLGVGCSVRF